ncbi:putative EF-hand domain-containing protein [Dioscorea sansibarensis]
MGIIRSLLRRRRSSKSKAASPSSPSSPSANRPGSSDLEFVFKKFDSNGDGQISTSELANILESLGQKASEEELSRMMAVADADGDGFISLNEFLDLMAADDASALEDLRHAFAVFDTDRSGSISAEELATVLRSLGEGASVAQCRRMIDSVDRDGDGMVSFEEFRIMMTSRLSSLTATHNI